MEIHELDCIYISDLEGVSGERIEPNEAIWKRAMTPANIFAMGLEGNILRLDPGAAQVAHVPSSALSEQPEELHVPEGGSMPAM